MITVSIGNKTTGNEYNIYISIYNIEIKFILFDSIFVDHFIDTHSILFFLLYFQIKSRTYFALHNNCQ